MSRYSFIENKRIDKAIEKRRYAMRWGYSNIDDMLKAWRKVNGYWIEKDVRYWRRGRSGSGKAMKKYSNRRIRGLKNVYSNASYRKIVDAWIWID